MERRTVTRDTKERGFSLVEVALVVVILMIAAGVGLPKMITALYTFRLRGSGTDISGILQTARWRAVQDDRFYSVCFAGAAAGTFVAYVDIYPQAINGASGTGCAGPISLNPPDPQIAITAQVAVRPQASAPNTANLRTQILPAGSPVVPRDGSNAATAATFGPRGLPCLATATNGGTVCDSAGGPQAYWVFFQHTRTQAWGAVTVTPAGRIQTWFYTGVWVVNQM